MLEICFRFFMYKRDIAKPSAEEKDGLLAGWQCFIIGGIAFSADGCQPQDTQLTASYIPDVSSSSFPVVSSTFWLSTAPTMFSLNVEAGLKYPFPPTPVSSGRNCSHFTTKVSNGEMV